ncbi:ComEC/Rec2 family competence protein [Herbiconiux ginsengi]|uniref:Competence protein ComEC n=1 Tax=Herbiconiux ginsengi TaxID=381665 RepID=A0A1H3T1N2_9MICO|nr:ComEC/Rec2 family competence protein [Herbiconiux ginsengi]SDZ43940.1 competence protein ComEC [Herbiconiux ginsengi]
MRADLRLALPAAAAWAASWLLVGAPALAASAVVVAWGATAAATLFLLVRARRRGSSWPRTRGAAERTGSGRTNSASAAPAASQPLLRNTAADARQRASHRAPRVAGRTRRYRGGVLPGMVLAAAAVALVCTSAFALGHLRHPPGLEGGRSRAGEAVVTVTGVAEPAASAAFGTDADGQRVTVDAVLETFDAAGTRTQARAPTLVFATVAHGMRLPIGASFRVHGTLTPLPPGESHEFLLFARDGPRADRGPPWYVAWADGVRTGFRHTTAGLPGDGADLLVGLAIGDDSGVSPALHDAMTVSGLTHLTAVSGANCAIVVSAVMLVGGALGLRRRIRVAVSILVLALFVVLVTPEPSVLRAATMAAIVLIALAAGRPSSGMPPLCLSVVVLLALDPWLARSAGFALSVLATGGLLLLTRPLASVGERFLPRWLALAVAVPVAAQLACQPVLFLLAPQITPYTLPANILAEPAAAAVSVLGLVVCLLGVVAPVLGSAAAWLPWAPSAWIAAVARFFASAPFAAIPVADGAVAAAAAVVFTLLFLVAVLAGRRHPRLAPFAGLLAAMAVVVGIGAVTGAALARTAAVPGEWQVAACDIGQGDAVLVHSRDRIALVDVGPDPQPLTDCLEQMHVQRIDLLVLTHYDRDHVGGLAAVIGRVDVALVGPTDGPADERLLTDLRDGGAQVADAARGQSGALGDYRWDILWPRAGAPLSGNEASVTVLFTGPMRLLFLGDLGEQAQDAVRAANRIGHVDVVKVAHHGSADQSERLYGDIRAVAGLISVGAGNSYGHPTDRLLGILGRVGTGAFRTDLGGLIVVAGTSAALSIWTEKPVPP